MSEDSQEKKYPPEGESRSTFEGTKFDDSDLQKVHSQLMREKEEPTENFSPMPLFLVAVFMVLAFWAGIYIVHYSGDFGPFHYDETAKAGAATADGPREVDMMALGARIYNQNCVACHQSNGRGLPNVYPPLVNSDWVKDDPHRLVNVILAGLAGPVTVNGKDYNNAMTAFGRLSDQQIAAVLTYIRTSPDYENDAPKVSEEMVAEVRAEYGERSDPWSQQELEAIYGVVDGQWVAPEAADGTAEDAESETAEDEVAGEEPAPPAEA